MSKKSDITKRESHIMQKMGLDIDSTKSISEIGRIAGTHKYDVWIAREVKKENGIINRMSDFQYIIDWAQKDRPNIFNYSFEDAFEASKNWHETFKNKDNKKIFEEDKDEERVVYKCKDGEHYFMLLNPSDLKIEGDVMSHCVGSYTSKVSSGRSLIISLRDRKNQPHATIEIDIKTSSVVQVRGKANSTPIPKYMKLITEFAIFSSGYEDEIDEEIQKLIDLKFN
jgi:hypothetical protein